MPLAFRKCMSQVWCNSSLKSYSPRNCVKHPVYNHIFPLNNSVESPQIPELTHVTQVTESGQINSTVTLENLPNALFKTIKKVNKLENSFQSYTVSKKPSHTY